MSAPTFEYLPTRNPEEVQFRVSVSATNFQPLLVPKLYTPYGETKLAPGGPFPASQIVGKLDGTLLKDYVYVYMSREGDKLWFYFAKNKTEDEQLTPFRTFTLYRKYNWPPILEALSFVEDDAFPIAVTVPDQLDPTGTGRAFAPRVTPRQRIVPATLALCECIVEQYLGPRPFPAETHQQPIAGNISWSFNGSQGSINALHPRIVVPSPSKEYKVVVNGTVGSVPAPSGPETIYPATNFESWSPFVLDDEIALENGLYFRELVTIIPPVQNDPVLI